MKPFATAYANNDVAIISWKYYAKIKDCLGFWIQREDTQGQMTSLPAWVGFEGQQNLNWEMKDTRVWPVQKFSWKDVTAPKDTVFIYHITPLVGTPDSLQPVSDVDLLLKTNAVALTAGTGSIKAYFNRGILSTQFVARFLPKNKQGHPDKNQLMVHIRKPGDKLRNALADVLIEAVPSC